MNDLTDVWLEWCEQEGSPEASESTTPSPVADRVRAFLEKAVVELQQLSQPGHWDLLCEVLTLHAVADEACANLGLVQASATRDEVVYRYTANKRLADTGSLSTFPTSRIRVLPKMRTPQTGISVRSLSLYATAIRCEVGVRWLPRALPRDRKTEHRFRLLLFPWPFQLSAESFAPADGSLDNLDATKFGFLFDELCKV